MHDTTPTTPHTTCGRIKPGDQRVGAACSRPPHTEGDHANGRGDTWPEPKQRGPHVGPRGESSREVTMPAGWTAEELERAEEHVRELLQRELEHAHPLASVPMHGAPAGRTRGYYAARAYLLACHLYPQRLVLALPTDDAPPMDLSDRMVTLVHDEPALRPESVSHYCPRCGTTGYDGPEDHAPVCDLLVQDRVAKVRDDG